MKPQLLGSTQVKQTTVFSKMEEKKQIAEGKELKNATFEQYRSLTGLSVTTQITPVNSHLAILISGKLLK